MHRAVSIACLLLLACDPAGGTPPVTDGGPGPGTDGGPAPGTDAGSPADGGSLPPGADAGLVAGDDAGSAVPVDCSAVSAAGFELCSASADSCELVFRDGAGCASACAAAGLVCGSSHEDVDGTCAADTSRPALGCVDTTHSSDHCTCVRGSGPVDPPPPGAPDCSTYPYDTAALLGEREGFGRNAQGGDPTNVYTVTTEANDGAGSLRRALESSEHYWIVFDPSVRHIRLRSGSTSERVYIASYKTIDGRGRDVTIEGNLHIRDTRHIIISDVTLTNDMEGHCTQEGDVITVRCEGGASPSDYASRDLWVNHVQLTNGGDGLLDIRGGTNVTISWSRVHTHEKAMLMSHDSSGGPSPGMRVSMHHNFFDRVTRRGPRFHWGWLHYYNNYQYQWFEYGVASVQEAQLASEGNIYEAEPGRTCGSLFSMCMDRNPCGDSYYEISKLAVSNDWASDTRGFVRSDGDLLLNDSVVQVNEPGRVFSPSAQYPYTVEPATPALASRIRELSGPRTSYCR